jgi:ParB/RepB/Spo0J family partition protein
MSVIPMKKQNEDPLKSVSLEALDAHPQNPRKIARPDVVEAIAAQLQSTGEFHASHAIIVRPMAAGRYQIVSGHNRVNAALEAGFKEVPAWVRDMTDEEAFMQLLLCNAQGQLHALEKGEHARLAVEGGMTLRAYAELISTSEDTVQQWKLAADVAVLLKQDFADLQGYMKHLAYIHAAPRTTWAEWVERLLENQWTVDELRAELQQHKSRQRAPAKTFYRTKEWEKISPSNRQKVLDTASDAEFNAQDSNNIEWARWSWNPITGCLHNCPYCYARDIANRFYPQGFDPVIIPSALSAARNTKVPSNAQDNVGYRNVFVCSMADLFGNWVPADWIEAVLDQVRANPQWNFLFLTKFPIRMAEFEYPDNAWLGTSVDLQARVKNAERAMSEVKAKVRWLSLEPLLECIEMDWSPFQWIVMGGSSASSETPPWTPPRDWIWKITFSAQMAGCAVYHKDNLMTRLRDYPDAIETKLSRAPAPFHYLKVVS